MTNDTFDNLMLLEQLAEANRKLDTAPLDDQSLREAALEFSFFADAARDSNCLELFRGGDLLSRVLELAACWCTQFQDDTSMVEELLEFARQNINVLEKSTKSSHINGEVDQFVGQAEEQWSEYFSLLDGDEFPSNDWTGEPEPTEDSDPDAANPVSENVPESQIELLLSALTDSGEKSTAAESADEFKASASGSTDASDEAARLELANDRELLEAYLDDALRCIGSMEQSALAIENAPESMEPIEQFCRELHTLKGASASVGLSNLAGYLHDLETSLETMFDGETDDVSAEPLFEAVDRVRDEIGSLQQNDSSSSDSTQTESRNVDSTDKKTNSKTEFTNFATNDDSSIRIRAAKLDRLMDMLAELVVLRNRRESHVAEFNAFNEELARCASRLSLAEEQLEFDAVNGSSASNPFDRNSSCTFSEVAKDITAVSGGMRELQKPVSLDNSAISRFIRDFRQELMQLRRIPVSGLFNRLQRAARDAAKSEDKQVQIKVIGEQAGLEQEIQERLYESLLHIVRNSVSHGIESEEKRATAGKSRIGTVTLEAKSSAQLLIIEVRDDGNGLDHEAVRKRAIEKGLLAANQRPSNDELAKLIFHPGFSTREQASAVSGRGVGMDIVSKTIEQLRGRVDIESVAGQGTTIRLSIPLRTGIEHVMVFRSGSQLFALPMQSVTAAKSSNTNIGEVAKLSLSSNWARSGSNTEGTGDVLLLRQSRSTGCAADGNSSPKTQIALAVDELIGPEEVVVRGLPNLMKNHPLFCGVTLSGSGEKVLLLESDRVLEFCNRHSDEIETESEAGQNGSGKSVNTKRALVVDDSLTARRVLVKLLQQHGFATVEAGDGIEAIERLHKEEFDLVLTDLDMPRFGGLELLADIQSSKYCDCPVVVVSSRNEEVFRTKAMDVGASEYVIKPVSELSITQLLENLELLPEMLKG